jgi:hypothetical protein
MGEELPALPDFMRRDIERAIEEAARPKGMSVHDGKARIGGDRLQRLLLIADTYAERIRQLERELATFKGKHATQLATKSIESFEFGALLGKVIIASEEMDDDSAYKEARAALIAYIDARTAGAAPEGWKLVPVEATEEMIKQACHDHGYPGGSRFYYQKYYKSMLSAAPTPLNSGKEEA